MPRKSAWVTLLATTLGYLGALTLAFFCTTDWAARQTVAVALTGLAVIWYTWETMLLRQTAHSEREYKLRPFVVFRATQTGYELANLGNGTALDIRVEPVVIGDGAEEMRIEFPEAIPLLERGATAAVVPRVTLNGKEVDPVFSAHLDPKYADQSVDMSVSFRGIESMRYELVQTIAPRTMELKGFS